MIVDVKLPTGKKKVLYGGSSLGVGADGTTDVPAYVAKSLVDAGATCPTLPSGSVATLLADAQPNELAYIIWAHGQAVGTNPYAPDSDYDKAAHADAVFSTLGEPAVVFE